MTPQLFSLPNLSSTDVVRVPVPLSQKLPTFRDKDAYRAWCQNPKTKHAFVSVWEGVIPSQRVTSGNEAVYLHGILAEFDKAALPANPDLLAAKHPCPPSYVIRSFSGYGRALWLFSAPVWVGNAKYKDALLKVILKDLRPKSLFAGFEESETTEPRYFEAGEWMAVPGASLIPLHKTDAWAFGAAEKHNWGRTTIPIDKVRAACAERWPNRWPAGWDNFQLGARGTRFWDSAGNAMSVIVVDNGCICYTGDKPFLSWGDILGAQFVKEAADEKIGRAVEGIYWESDANKYWRDGTNIGLQAVTVENMRLHLRDAGLSDCTNKDTPMSEVDRALIVLQKTKSVHFSGPVLFNKERVCRVNGTLVLNTSQISALPPAPEAAAWGEKFPWLASFYSNHFTTREAIDHYLAWLRYFYLSCLAGDPEPGHTVLIAGPTNCGKTWHNEVVMKRVFGGIVDATKFLMGDDNFNGNLFSYPIWALDDSVCHGDYKKRDIFSQSIKQVTANNELFYRKMQKEGRNMPRTGRVVVTLNDDADSLRMVPDLERGLGDKISLFRAKRPEIKWASEEQVASELPHFLAWLKAWSPPVAEDNRFGVANYHDPDLLVIAKDANSATSFAELVEMWRSRYWKDPVHKDDEYWQGTPLEFLGELQNTPDMERIVQSNVRSTDHLAQLGMKLTDKGFPWFQRKRSNGKRLWVILKPGLEPADEPY